MTTGWSINLFRTPAREDGTVVRGADLSDGGMMVADVDGGSGSEGATDWERGSTLAGVGSWAGSWAGVGERDGTWDFSGMRDGAEGSSLDSSEGRSTAGEECEGSDSHDGCWTVVGSSHPAGSGTGSDSSGGAGAGVEVCSKGAEAGD